MMREGNKGHGQLEMNKGGIFEGWELLKFIISSFTNLSVNLLSNIQQMKLGGKKIDSAFVLSYFYLQWEVIEWYFPERLESLPILFR